MPPPLVGVRDGGNAVQAGTDPAKNNSVDEKSVMPLRPSTPMLKPRRTRPCETESIGMAPMSEPNGSNTLAEADDRDMANSPNKSGCSHLLTGPQEPWRKDDFFLISLC